MALIGLQTFVFQFDAFVFEVEPEILLLYVLVIILSESYHYRT